MSANCTLGSSPRGRVFPHEELGAAAVECVRLAGVQHHGDAGALRVQHIGVFAEEVAHHEVEMPVAVHVGLSGGVREPAIGLARSRRAAPARVG